MIILWVISVLAVASASHKADPCPPLQSYYCGCNVIDLPEVIKLKMCLHGKACIPCPMALQSNIDCQTCPLNACPICSLQNFGMGRLPGYSQENMSDSKILEQKFIKFTPDEGVFHLQLYPSYEIEPNSYYSHLMDEEGFDVTEVDNSKKSGSLEHEHEANAKGEIRAFRITPKYEQVQPNAHYPYSSHGGDTESLNKAETNHSQGAGSLRDRHEGNTKEEASAGEASGHKVQPNAGHPLPNSKNGTVSLTEAVQKLKILKEQHEEYSKQEKGANRTDGVHQSRGHSRFRRYANHKAESYRRKDKGAEKYRSRIKKNKRDAILQSQGLKHFNFGFRLRDFSDRSSDISGSKGNGKLLRFSKGNIFPMYVFVSELDSGIKGNEGGVNNRPPVGSKYKKGMSNLRKINRNRKVDVSVLPPFDRRFEAMDQDDIGYRLISYIPISELSGIGLNSSLKKAPGFSSQISYPIEIVEAYSDDKCVIKNISNDSNTKDSLSERWYDFQCLIAVYRNTLEDYPNGTIFIRLSKTEDIFLLKENIKNCFSGSTIKLYDIENNTAFIDQDCPIPITSKLLIKILKSIVKIGVENSQIKLIQSFNVPQNTGLVKKFVVTVQINNLTLKKHNTLDIAFTENKKKYDFTGQLKLDMQFYLKENSDAKHELLHNKTEYDKNLLLDFSLLTNDTFEKGMIFLPRFNEEVAESKTRSSLEKENRNNFFKTLIPPQFFHNDVKRNRKLSLDSSLREMLSKSISDLSSEDIYRSIALKFPWISSPSSLNPLNVNNRKPMFFFNVNFDFHLPLWLAANALQQYARINPFAKDLLTSPISDSSYKLFTQQPGQVNSDAKNMEENGKIFAYLFKKYQLVPKEDIMLGENFENDLDDSKIFDILNISASDLKELKIYNSDCTTCSIAYKLMLDSGRTLDLKKWRDNTNSSFLAFMNKPEFILHSNTSKISSNVVRILNESFGNQRDQFTIQTNIELIFMSPEKFEDFRTSNNTALENTNWNDLNSKFILSLPDSFSSQSKLLNCCNSHVFSLPEEDPSTLYNYNPFAEYAELLNEIHEVVLAMLAKMHDYHGLSDATETSHSDVHLGNATDEGAGLSDFDNNEAPLGDEEREYDTENNLNESYSDENIVPEEVEVDTTEMQSTSYEVNSRKRRAVSEDDSFNDSTEDDSFEDSTEDVETEDYEKDYEEDYEEEEENKRKDSEKKTDSPVYINSIPHGEVSYEGHKSDSLTFKGQNDGQIQESNSLQTQDDSKTDLTEMVVGTSFSTANIFDEIEFHKDRGNISDYENITDRKETDKSENQQFRNADGEYQKQILPQDRAQPEEIIVYELKNILNLSSPDAGLKEMKNVLITVLRRNHKSANVGTTSRDSFPEESEQRASEGVVNPRALHVNRLHVEDKESESDKAEAETSMSSDTSDEPVQLRNEVFSFPEDIDLSENEIPDEPTKFGRRLLQDETTEPYEGDDDEDDAFTEADDFVEFHTEGTTTDDFVEYIRRASEAGDFPALRRRRSVPENKWCTLDGTVHHGDLECTFWTYKKSCLLKCHPGYEYDGKPEMRSECGRRRNTWEPPINSCETVGPKSDAIPEPNFGNDSPAGDNGGSSDDSEYEDGMSEWERSSAVREKAKSYSNPRANVEPVGKEDEADYQGHYMEDDDDDEETPFEYYNYKED